MARQQSYHRLLQLTAFAWLILRVSARGRGGGYSDGAGSDESGGGGWFGYGPGTGTSSGNRFGGSGGSRGSRAGFDVESAMSYRRIHGILAAAAMVLLFPIGSILLRVLPGRVGFWAHAIFQALALCVYIAGAALGIRLVQMVRIPNFGSLLEDPSTNYHPIIGIVLLVLFVVQPVVGVIHHRVFKKLQKRQGWSYLHLVNGRLGISLGIINGGLGLHLASASDSHKRAYAIVAGIMWVLWMAVAVWAELRRARRSRRASAVPEATNLTKVVTGERRDSED